MGQGGQRRLQGVGGTTSPGRLPARRAPLKAGRQGDAEHLSRATSCWADGRLVSVGAAAPRAGYGSPSSTSSASRQVGESFVTVSGSAENDGIETMAP